MITRQNPLKRIAVVIALLAALAACGNADASPSVAAPETTGAPTESSTIEGTSDEGAGDEEVDAVVVSEGSVDLDAAIADNQSSHFDDGDLDYQESDVVHIDLDDAATSADSGGVQIEGTTITITDEGTYQLRGTLTDGEIIVDAPDSADLTLILDGVNITNTDGAAIAVLEADDVVILLASGSTNQLADGAAYTFPDDETDEPNAALYSAADLTIAGEGELIVSGNYNDAITSKDGLVLAAAGISVDAIDDGIRGKDYVIVESGQITIDAGGDGIKADNDEDVERGYVLISGGTTAITAGDDGVQAATDALMSGGELFMDAAGRGIQGDVMVVVSGGVLDASAGDDAIHANDGVTIDGGTLMIAAGDDGIHGDYYVTINNGEITITESYEGIEAEIITINDGTLDLTSSDDGLNVADADTEAAAEPAAGERPEPGAGRGAGRDEAVGEHYIYINGGTTAITILGDLNEQGDGIDANGHVEMTGGIVTVSGPTDTRNSALDYSGGTFEMTGGTIIGTNVDGRNSEGIGVGSSQASIYLTTGTTVEGGTVVHIETMDGESLVTFEPKNVFSVVVFSSPDLVAGQDYNIYFGGSVSGESTTGLYDDAAYTHGESVGTVTATV